MSTGKVYTYITTWKGTSPPRTAFNTLVTGMHLQSVIQLTCLSLWMKILYALIQSTCIGKMYTLLHSRGNIGIVHHMIKRS